MLHSDKTVNAYHVTGERDDLHEKFSSSVLDLQHKSGLKYSVLERKISSLRAELDVRDAQLQTVLENAEGADEASGMYLNMYIS